MEIVKRQVIDVNTTDGKKLEVGTNVYLNALGYVILGTFKGISKKGALMFDGIGKFTDVTFNIMPKSIEEMYIADSSLFASMTFEGSLCRK